MCVVAPEPPSAYLGDLPDDKLITAFRSGVDEAFAELDRRHRCAVCGYVAGMLHSQEQSEDIAQDVMVRAASALRRDDRSVPHRRAWLLRVARNRTIDLLRASHPADELPATLPGGPDASTATAQAEELRLALAVLRSLPDGQRRALVLNALHGVPFDDVARALGTSPKGARAPAFRGRPNARRQMAADLAPDVGSCARSD
jgi:RNA polymerase sigma-70 factor (ECF subfamily)